MSCYTLISDPGNNTLTKLLVAVVLTEAKTIILPFNLADIPQSVSQVPEHIWRWNQRRPIVQDHRSPRSKCSHQPIPHHPASLQEKTIPALVCVFVRYLFASLAAVTGSGCCGCHGQKSYRQLETIETSCFLQNHPNQSLLPALMQEAPLSPPASLPKVLLQTNA